MGWPAPSSFQRICTYPVLVHLAPGSQGSSAVIILCLDAARCDRALSCQDSLGHTADPVFLFRRLLWLHIFFSEIEVYQDEIKGTQSNLNTLRANVPSPSYSQSSYGPWVTGHPPHHPMTTLFLTVSTLVGCILPPHDGSYPVVLLGAIPPSLR